MSDNILDRLNARLRVSRLIQQAQDESQTQAALAVDYPQQVVCRFHEGPKDGESIDMTVPHGRGNPQRITVVAIEPESEELRKGYYRQSTLAPTLYLWDGWGGPAEPIRKA